MTATPEPTPVLLVADGFYSVLAALRALRTAGYAPWLAVYQRGTYAARSRAKVGTVSVPSPDSDREGFVRELAAAAAQLSVAAVLPSAEIHLVTLAGRQADFPGIALGSPSRENVGRAIDKKLLPELAAAAGLQTPPTAVVRGDDNTANVFDFPAILKPRHGRMRNPDGTVPGLTRYVSSERQLEEALEVLPSKEILVQPYIPGALVSVSGVSWEGKLICALHRRAIRIHPMPAGVSSYAETIPPDAKLEQGVGHLMQAIGWSGIFQAQFIRSQRGEHYLIDLNPRIYGSLALAVAAGLNLPAIWLDLLLGRRPHVGGYRVGARFRQEEKDWRTLMRMLAHGSERRSALRGLLPKRNTTHAILSLRDPMPVLTSVVTQAGWLLRR